MDKENEKKVWVSPAFTEELLINTNVKIPNAIETRSFSS
jgi:hypothetical protein